MRLLIILFACLLPFPAFAFKGMDTRDIEPACVMREVKDVINIGVKWWLKTKNGLVPVLGIKLPDGASSTGKRLMHYLKARYKNEIVKVCRPNFMPMRSDVYGFIYSEPWPLSLQDELLEKGLAYPRKP